MFWKAVVVVSGLTVSLACSALCAEYSKAMNSAARIYWEANGGTAFLFECADYDKQNAANYMSVFEQYIAETKALMDRVTTIMKMEQSRSGRPPEELSKALYQTKTMAANEMEKMRREDPKFLANC